MADVFSKIIYTVNCIKEFRKSGNSRKMVYLLARCFNNKNIDRFYDKNIESGGQLKHNQ